MLEDLVAHIVLMNATIDRSCSFLWIVVSALLSPVACRSMGTIRSSPAEEVIRPSVWLAALIKCRLWDTQTAPDSHTVIILQVNCTPRMGINLPHHRNVDHWGGFIIIASESILDVRPNALLQASMGLLGNVRFRCATEC